MKAIILFSGGLDSSLAAKLMQNLGLELIALNTVTPFCLCSRHSPTGCFHSAGIGAKNLGLKLIGFNVAEEFLEIVKNPKHGYGSNMNPCIDCRILLFKKAKELMHKEGASFIITGEVLGQRPMSQRKDAMRLIDKEAGLENLVLRPLSARVLERTIPEEKGWIDRDKLLAISGRGRRSQLDLADELGINDYPCPSGGCLLTDPEFSKRVKDLIKHRQFNLDEVLLTKLGRHFRLNDTAKLAVGRNETENAQLLNLAKEGDFVFMPKDIAGPTALGRGSYSGETITLSCSIVCRYCDLGSFAGADICYRKTAGKEDKILYIAPIEQNKLVSLKI